LGRRLAGAVLQGAGAGILQQAQQRRQDTLLKIRRQWQQQDRAQARAWSVEDRQASEALTREGWDRADARAADNQPLATVFNPETGRNEYVQRDDAIGMEPGRQGGAKRPTAKGADGYLYYTDTKERVFPGVTKAEEDKLIKSGQDPLTGEITYELESDVIAGLKGAGAAPPPSPEEEEALMDRASAARKRLGPSWTETDYWNPAVGSEEWLGTGDEEFDQRLAQMIRENPNVPDDELARRLAAELTGGQGQQGGEGGQGDGQTAGTEALAADSPPPDYPNAQKAPDGNWYIPDPDRPGKWLRVRQ
jgi:hypothetical protein